MLLHLFNFFLKKRFSSFLHCYVPHPSPLHSSSSSSSAAAAADDDDDDDVPPSFLPTSYSTHFSHPSFIFFRPLFFVIIIIIIIFFFFSGFSITEFFYRCDVCINENYTTHKRILHITPNLFVSCDREDLSLVKLFFFLAPPSTSSLLFIFFSIPPNLRPFFFFFFHSSSIIFLVITPSSSTYLF